jgi:thiol:disulfide interchange protein
VAIFVYSFTLGEAVGQMWAFLWFGLGFGVPLIAIALFDLAENWDMLQLYWT